MREVVAAAGRTLLPCPTILGQREVRDEAVAIDEGVRSLMTETPAASTRYRWVNGAKRQGEHRRMARRIRFAFM